MKTCSRCKVKQDLTSFHKGNHYCKPCKKEYDKTYSKNWHFQPYNQVKRYASHILKRYGLSVDDLTTMYETQGGGCAICNKSIPNPTEEGAKRFITSIDHNHACCPTETSCGTCVRGLLCRDCNLMLGHAKDDLETLKKAVNYLELNSLKVGTHHL
jgi:hypothetical protein